MFFGDTVYKAGTVISLLNFCGFLQGSISTIHVKVTYIGMINIPAETLA